ncbi:bifunctional tRNA (5-methylaminomethyl-2-thiouridine)(34)-methyltransferase MnmD/FAD-dependent 5-carboxymethylaminomethyl-2-thiouridine(34) oxidoreductase MnmC [Paraburkholderia edwinii]|uniref:tRNA 5-methylaminomethyl-2-thiouridine biosynthesis bifunctional protein MnmC n=1 Tax=Paraburkholderia edwinii TaxID=2861782 RepID=A0ABX8UP03_9BURK|nr:bifunctional tRNA (5-methylaminomethyl-2-thiouridine)(34)-methyltransferase MnmD/FAD-dependent 5-carboxymethylaminomethyl-2-thiouridine(34) oxidoreductase MnmC [Paraburkholderia edwinii]QYD69087.1 bifunctional tRNA (5-methylaminomethyl-2-thiouridine)(34)-methyltransferase MnmD/FAD-dependent 5-carboxymethylaminomethyl-2-thiouridine(34) oxidoreductase MnmC [Paraburkholderia edwinii]
MTATLTPATLVFRADGTPYSPRHDDIYHSAAGAFAQADHVFLKGNALPERWRGRRIFSILEIGFGLGVNFLTTWAQWRADPARCERLHFVSIEKHPFSATDLRTAHEAIVADASIARLFQTLSGLLADAWPMLVPGMHRLEFEDGRVTLTLVFGDAIDTLPSLSMRADAFYLDGFAPAKNPELWSPQVFRSLTRVAADDATVATYSSAGDVKRGLAQAGFECTKVDGFASKRAMLVGRFAPRWRVRRYEPPLPLALSDRHAVVIGAGLAGCAITERLAARGWRVTSLERHHAAAREASGNPAGVFHPMLSRDDSVASRITRAGFLYALRRWSMLADLAPSFAHRAKGLLQIAESEDEAQSFAQVLASLQYPADFVTAVSRDEAAQIAGMPVTRGGCFFPHGGWIDPAQLCAAQCASAGDLLERRYGVEAARVERSGDQWTVFDAAGQTLVRAPVVIFANAHDAARVAGLNHTPTRSVRGQLTLLPNKTFDTFGSLEGLRLPVIGEGYAVPLADGTKLVGATYDIDDADTALRAAAHTENIERVARMLPSLAGQLTSVASPSNETGRRDASHPLTGRVAFRCVTSDRLPMIGTLADEAAAIADAAKLRGAWPRDLPRANGLLGAFAYGSRGLVWAALGAELIASQLEGEPWPIERELAEAIDPARFLLRALRHDEFD